MIEVRYQRGLYLPELDLWLDPQRAKPRAFVSHAHGDHFARHPSALCSPVTAALIHARFKLPLSRIDAQPFHVTCQREGFLYRLLPAGHIPGSAMLHLTRLRDGATLLYTGDFKTRAGRTAEAVSFLPADTLILETTFGLPTYRFPPEAEIEAQLGRFIADTFAASQTPVLMAYSLGKAQEAVALLAALGIPVVQHPAVAEMTAACRAAGVPGLPEPLRLTGAPPPGHVVIAPPHTLRSKVMRTLTAPRTAMLTGWALQPGAKYRYRVDAVIALSDHADHPGLHDCLRQVRPKKILTVHGYTKEFAAELRSRQLDAWCAQGGDQLELPIGLEPDNAAGE
jgi:DNA ligase-1